MRAERAAPLVSMVVQPAATAAERFNSSSHAVGALLSLLGLGALVARGLAAADRVMLASFVVYGSSLVALYTASTLYHALAGRAKLVFQKVDHIAIYLLIAGSYTPFALVRLRTSQALTLLAVVWGLAVLGAVIEFVPRGHVLSVVLYLAMGWLALLVLRPLARALPGSGLTWLLLGGVFYTLGVAFYVIGHRRPAAHGVFHVFVLLGSLSHFITVWVYLD